MADELEPYIPEIEPTCVYGPDDWRPYSYPGLRDVLDAILYRWAQEERRKVYEPPVGTWLTGADPGGRATFRYGAESARTPDEYKYTADYLSPALLEAQRRMRARIEFSMRIQDPAAIIRITGTGM